MVYAFFSCNLVRVDIYTFASLFSVSAFPKILLHENSKPRNILLNSPSCSSSFLFCHWPQNIVFLDCIPSFAKGHTLLLTIYANFTSATFCLQKSSLNQQIEWALTPFNGNCCHLSGNLIFFSLRERKSVFQQNVLEFSYKSI